MKRYTNRQEFKNGILLAMGHPYINVNLTDEHLDLCINNALKLFWKFHPHGSVETFYVYQITDTDVVNGYIPSPAWIDGVVECLPRGFALSEMSFATFEYQMTRDVFMSASRFMGVSLVDYVTMKGILYNTSQVINGPMTYEFDRYRRRIIPYFKYATGQFVAFRAYENVDPEKDDNPNAPDAPNVWDDEVLKELAIAECKLLWGDILSKFGGIRLPGGVTLDGERLIAEGKALKAETLETLQSNNVIDFIMG